MGNAGQALKDMLHTVTTVLTCKDVGKEWAGQTTTTFTPSQVRLFLLLRTIIKITKVPELNENSSIKVVSVAERQPVGRPT